MQQVPGIYILETSEKGRGIYTAVDIPTSSIIEICPVVIIPTQELPIIHKTILHDYYFMWEEEKGNAAIALGYGSLYNHAIHPNANFILDFANHTIDIISIKPINAGEEITLNYHGEPGNSDALWFDDTH